MELDKQVKQLQEKNKVLEQENIDNRSEQHKDKATLVTKTWKAEGHLQKALKKINNIHSYEEEMNL